MREVLGEELSARNFVADAIQAPWSGSRPFRERSHLAKMDRIYEAAVGPEAVAKHSPLAWSALGAAQHWLRSIPGPLAWPLDSFPQMWWREASSRDLEGRTSEGSGRTGVGTPRVLRLLYGGPGPHISSGAGSQRGLGRYRSGHVPFTWRMKSKEIQVLTSIDSCLRFRSVFSFSSMSLWNSSRSLNYTPFSKCALSSLPTS